MSAYTDKVRPRTLKRGLSALGSGGRSFEEGSHLCFMYLKKNIKKIEQCHQLLLVLGGDLGVTVAVTGGHIECMHQHSQMLGLPAHL